MKKKSGSSFAPVPAILNALDDLKVQNPVTLDVRGQSDMFDTLIIASGTSSRQVRALAQHVMEELKKKGFPPSGYEGLDAGEWALIDYGDIVVHVMLPDIRSFYDIEGLWQVPVVATTTNTTTKPTAKAANTNKKAVSPTGVTKVSAAKKPTSSTKKGTDSSSAVKKPVAKKPVAKKTTEKKTIEKKTTDKKPKTTTRTTASKKTVGQPKTSSKTTTRTGTNATPATRSKTSTPKKTTVGSATTRSRKKTT